MNKLELIKKLTDLNIKLDWDRVTINLIILEIEEKVKENEEIQEPYLKQYEILKKEYETAKKIIMEKFKKIKENANNNN